MKKFSKAKFLIPALLLVLGLIYVSIQPTNTADWSLDQQILPSANVSTMEHPTKILTDIRSEQELVNTFSLFFEKFPTYTELVSGTPKLSLVFKLSEEFKVNQDLLVRVQQIEPRMFLTPQGLFVSF